MAAIRTMFLDGIDRQAAESILEGLQAATAPMRVAQLRVLGGAMARVPYYATAFAHRRSSIMANVVAIYERPEERPVHEDWVAGLAAELRQDDAGAYVGFLGDEGEERVRAAYPGRDLGPAGGDQGALRPGPTSSGSTRTSRRRLPARPAARTPSRRARPSPPQRITTSWLYSNTGRAIGESRFIQRLVVDTCQS